MISSAVPLFFTLWETGGCEDTDDQDGSCDTVDVTGGLRGDAGRVRDGTGDLNCV